MSQRLKIITAHPESLTEEQQVQLVDLLKHGNQLAANNASSAVQNCQRLFLAIIDDTIVGMTAIKKYRHDYTNRIFTDIGHQNMVCSIKKNLIENGYTCVRKEFRNQGICDQLFEERFRYIEKHLKDTRVFSTVRIGNSGMIDKLLKHGFTKIGQYTSQMTQNELAVMLK